MRVRFLLLVYFIRNVWNWMEMLEIVVKRLQSQWIISKFSQNSVTLFIILNVEVYSNCLQYVTTCSLTVNV